jgi:hypothetical protein
MKLSQTQADTMGGCQECQAAAAPAVPPDTAAAAPSVMTADPSKPDWITISLAHPDGTPAAAEAFSLECADGAIVTGRLDPNGKVRVEGIAPGACKVSFPERDAREWKAKR